MKTTDFSRPNDGAIIFLSQYTPCPCEARPGWPYMRFTRDGRFLAVLEEIIDQPLDDRILVTAGWRFMTFSSAPHIAFPLADRNHGIVTRTGWRRLNLSMHAEWLVYQHCDDRAAEIWKYLEAERLHRF